MMLGYSTKKKVVLIIISLAFILSGLFISLYSPVIFQEGNPWPQLKGAFQLSLTDKGMVAIADNRYMTRSENGLEIIKKYLTEKGYRFVEQMGSGYFYQSGTQSVTVARRQYSRFYVIWTISKSDNINNSVGWRDYKNKEFGFTFRYPSLSIDNQLWGNLTEILPLSEVLLPNEVLDKGNNFYLHQKYSLSQDMRTGKVIKTENVFIPEYDGSYHYPLAWHIVIFSVKNEADLDRIIKTKLGPGCSYKTKIATSFEGNYRVEIDGDGKDLGETLCPVNYNNYIIYSPSRAQVAFWSTGQECQIGLGFMSENCFDQIISESFHFYQSDSTPESIVEELQECLPKSDMASHEKCSELLATIRNFSDCVAAGFSIMKSNPPQCAAPDGRIFTDETNSSWDMVLTALNDCEVESVFQSHSRFVSVDLKNGNKMTTYEPQIDDIMNAVDSLGGRCGNIRMATE